MSPIRMCIICRKRVIQSELIRLQCADNKLVKRANRISQGRSFYLCRECIIKPDIAKQIAQRHKNKELNIELIEALKGEL